MKKTVFALLGVFALSAFAYAGPQPLSSNDKQVVQSAPSMADWYRDNEWNVGIWGAYAFTSNGGFDFPEDAFNEDARFDHYLGSDDAWGGGIDLKYFFRRYFGVGIEAYGLTLTRDAPSAVLVGTNGVPFEAREEDKTVGAVLGTFTLRYPIGDSRFAPYIFGGVGVIFGGGDVQTFEHTGITGNGQDYFEAYRGGNDTEFVGQFGGGLEVRVTRHIGIIADFNWNVVNGNDNNFGMARAGVNFAF
ncbi:MAG: outer membrane protein beta-barrel domain [Verrucomicrobiota bacterium]|jgi:hypothetical protein